MKGCIYTILANPAVDELVESHLQKIVKGLTDLMGDGIEAIILTGGFGRGEGSVSISGTGKIHIVNDYDIEVVYKEGLSRFLSKLIAHLRYKKRITRLAEILADDFNMKQIDLVLKGSSGFRSAAPPQLADYDRKYGHKLLHGKYNPVSLMPEYRSGDIPLFEGTWLLRNRGCGLILAYFYFSDSKLKEGTEEYFYIEINKAILAMGDALFIATSSYTCSYAERADRISDILPVDFEYVEELASLYPLASRYKLKPQSNMYPGHTPLELWYRINRIYCKFFLRYESQRLNTLYPDMESYITVTTSTTRLNVKQRARIAFDRMRGIIDKGSVEVAYLKVDKLQSVAYTFALLSARYNDPINDSSMRILDKFTKCIAKPQSANSRWTELARAYLLLIHPQGEAKRVMESK